MGTEAIPIPIPIQFQFLFSQNYATKNEAETKTTDAGGETKQAPLPASAIDGGKKEEEPIDVVLKMDLHCEVCARKVRRYISHLGGVMKVKADCIAKKLTVTGNVNPTWLRLTVENKTKKKVQLISPPHQTDDKNPENEKPKENTPTVDNSNTNNNNPQEAVVSTIVLKIKLHCDGCAQKVEKVIQRKIVGVHSVQTDLQKNLVTLTGTMDVKKLTSYLKEKLQRNVDVLTPPNKDNGDKAANDDGVSIERKGKKSAAVAGDEKESKSGEEGTKVEVNKMSYRNNYNSQTYYSTPIYNHTSHVSQGYTMPAYNHTSYFSQGYSTPAYSYQPYSGSGYVAHYGGPATPPPTFLNMNDNMFSDENPNGCFVM